MTLDILTASQRKTYYANIESKYHVYIPDESPNVFKVLSDIPNMP